MDLLSIQGLQSWSKFDIIFISINDEKVMFARGAKSLLTMFDYLLVSDGFKLMNTSSKLYLGLLMIILLTSLDILTTLVLSTCLN